MQFFSLSWTNPKMEATLIMEWKHGLFSQTCKNCMFLFLCAQCLRLKFCTYSPWVELKQQVQRWRGVKRKGETSASSGWKTKMVETLSLWILVREIRFLKIIMSFFMCKDMHLHIFPSRTVAFYFNTQVSIQRTEISACTSRLKRGRMLRSLWQKITSVLPNLRRELLWRKAFSWPP